MGLRFRKSIRLAPGIRLNAGVRGLSLTLGPRGASINLSSRGAYGNASFMGFSARERLSAPAPRRAPARLTQSSAPTEFVANVSVDDAGSLIFKDDSGTELPPDRRQAALRQRKIEILELLERAAEGRNRKLDMLAKLHEAIPDARKPPSYAAVPFQADPPDRPAPPTPKSLGLLGWLFGFVRSRLEAENELAQQAFEHALAGWKAAIGKLANEKVAHDKAERMRKRLFEQDVLASGEAREKALGERLAAIDWPRETLIDFDLSEDGGAIRLDVDLPEIEDMPTETWVVAKREVRLSPKALPQTRVRELYMRHVHSVGLRIAGEVFATLPTCQELCISAYSQRPDNKTGNIEDQYLYSAKATRAQWMTVNFDNLADLDPVAAYEAFELRRQMTKTGTFKPVEPM